MSFEVSAELHLYHLGQGYYPWPRYPCGHHREDIGLPAAETRAPKVVRNVPRFRLEPQYLDKAFFFALLA
jgi:hypothetical protein